MKYNNATKTRGGYAVRNVQFNTIGKCYIGQVADPTFADYREWTSCSWNKRGECRNQTRRDCNLVLPEVTA